MRRILPNHFRITLLIISILMFSLFADDKLIKSQEFNTKFASIHKFITSQIRKDVRGKSEKKYQNSIQTQVQVLAVEEKKEISPTPKSVLGKSVQVDKYTWSVSVKKDDKQATADEILVALNKYRKSNGVGVITRDENLQSYAQSRALKFANDNKLDSHAEFQNLINNENGFEKLGFNALGENSSFGYQLEAIHLIELVYAADKPHDENQKNPLWTHVGIGVSGLATDIIFAGKKK